MEEERIKRAAIELCTTEGQEEWLKDYGILCFEDGARWRIDSAWHEANKEIPIPFRPILVEHDDGRFSVNMVGGNMKSCPLAWARWAYIDDLLPGTRKEGEP